MRKNIIALLGVLLLANVMFAASMNVTTSPEFPTPVALGDDVSISWNGSLNGTTFEKVKVYIMSLETGAGTTLLESENPADISGSIDWTASNATGHWFVTVWVSSEEYGMEATNTTSFMVSNDVNVPSEPEPNPPVLDAEIGLEKTVDKTKTTAGPVTYTYVVSNQGTAPLSNIELVDNELGIVASGFSLSAGEDKTFTVDANIAKTTSNTAEVCGFYNDVEYCDSDSATVRVIPMELDLQVTASEDSVNEGEEVTFTYTVINRTDNEINSITLYDLIFGFVELEFNLDAGEIAIFEKKAQIWEDTNNEVSVVGYNPYTGGAVGDMDWSVVDVIEEAPKCYAEITINEVYSSGRGSVIPTIFVGSVPNVYTKKVTLDLTATDSGMVDNSDGLSIQRLENQLSMTNFGLEGIEDRETIFGSVVLYNAEFTGIENGPGYDGLENQGDGYWNTGPWDDEAMFDSPSRARFYTTTNTGIDSWKFNYECN